MLIVLAPSPPVPAVSTRSSRCGRTREHVAAHRLRAAGDLVRGLALEPERDEEAADLRLRRLAAHDLVHHLVRLRPRQRAAFEQVGERLLDHVRKFRAEVGAERRQHALGMELDALDRELAVAHAHHLAVRRAGRHLELVGDLAARRASGSGPPRTAPAGRRRRPCRRARPARTCRAGAPAPGRSRRRRPRRSPGGRGRRRASARAGRAAGSARPRCPRRPAGRGRGRSTSCAGASASASSTVIASFRNTRTSAPSSSNRCTRL